MSPVNRTTGSARISGVDAVKMPAARSQRGYAIFARLVNAIINIPASLIAVPVADHAQAWRQGRSAGVTDADSPEHFLALIRQRLQLPDAQELMRPPVEAHPFSSVSRWLPEIPGPLLSEDRQNRIITFLFADDRLTARLAAGEHRALRNLLVDEINQAAAEQQQGYAQWMLPQLLRLKLVSDLLQRLHPLLPVVIWAAQVLWQIRHHGWMNALDAELKRQLWHWMAALDIAGAAAQTPRQAVSDTTIFLHLNRWVDQWLTMLRGGDAAPPAPLPAQEPPQVALHGDGWQHNSDLNNPASAASALLVKVNRCYELIKPVNQPINFAVGCALSAENRTFSPPESGYGAQFVRGVSLDDAGKLWLSLRIESGDPGFVIQQLTPAARRPRPLPLHPLAGAEDKLMMFPAEAAESNNRNSEALVSALIGWSAEQLRQPAPLTDKLTAVSGWPGHVTGDNVASLQPSACSSSLPLARETAVIPLRPGFFNHQLYHLFQLPAGYSQHSANSAWPLPAAAADIAAGTGARRARRALFAVADTPYAGLSVEDFYDSLLFKYREELTKHPQITLIQNDKGVIREQRCTLIQALQIIFEAEGNTPQLSLEYHPEWSSELCQELTSFALKNYVPDIDLTQPMDWESFENHYAAWQTGEGLARKGMDKMAAIIQKMQSPVWDVTRWIEDKISQMVRECGGDSSKITGSTPVGVGVRLPLGLGRQNLPVPVLAGSWNPVGNYSLQEILTREYLRGNYRYESLEFRFPPEIPPRLQKKIIETDIQSIYMQQLTEALSEGEVKEGILSLFKTLFNRAIDAWALRASQRGSYFDTNNVYAAVANGRVYHLKLHNYPLNNLVFIPVNDAESLQGVLLSLWGGKSWEVKIDLTGKMTFCDDSHAEQLRDLMYESMPIKARSENTPAAIDNNQIIINTSGHYKVDFEGKTWVKKTWVAPTIEKSIMALVKTEKIEKALLGIFIHTLKLDMDYLVKSNAEHIRDSAIEVLTTVAWMVGLYTVPTMGIQLAGASASATKLIGALTNWKTSLTAVSTLTIFPNLVKGASADRYQEAQKAYFDAALGMLGEGAGYLFGSLCPRVLIGLFKQGSKAIKVSVEQIPHQVLQRITREVKRTFSVYQEEISRIYGFTQQQRIGKPQYPFSLKARLPAPVRKIERDLTGFPSFLATYYQDLARKDLFADPLKMPAILQKYLQSKRYQVEIGGLVQWGSTEDRLTRYIYLLRARPEQPQHTGRQQEVEYTILDFFPEKYVPGNIKGIFVKEQQQWMAMFACLPQHQVKATSIEWFSTLDRARGQYLALKAAESEFAITSNAQILNRPAWYHRAIIGRALDEINQQQQTLRKAIHQRENNINFLKSGAETLSLQLGELFASGKLQPWDSLGKKLNLLAANPICKRAVALPEGDYRLVATDLRGISSDNQGNVTLMDYGSPAALLRQQRIQGYRPDQIHAVGMAAEISSLYAARVDEYVVEHPGHKQEAEPCVPQIRLQQLADNAQWLGRSGKYLKVPLIVAVNHTAMTPDIARNNQLEATLPAEAILFVLAPDETTRQVSHLLAQLRSAPIPVSPLLIDDALRLPELIKLAESYALLPDWGDRQTPLHQRSQPWLAIINLQAKAGFVTPDQARRLRQKNFPENIDGFLGDSPKLAACREDILAAQSGARIVFYDVDAGPGEPPVAHAMMMLNEGTAVGDNNQLIGGAEGWQKMYLMTLNWIDDPRYGFVLDVGDSKFSLRIQTSDKPPQWKPAATVKNLTNEIRLVISLAENQQGMDTANDWRIADSNASGWMAVIKLYQQAGLFSPEKVSQLITETRENNFQLLLGQHAQIARSLPELLNAVPGSLLVFVEKTGSGSKTARRMVHAMIVVYGTFAIGLNNQVLGGERGWKKIHLGALSYSADMRRGLAVEVEERRFNCFIVPPWS